MITPSAPPSGTWSWAVTEWDLFLRLITRVLGETPHAAEQELRVAGDQRRAPGEVGVEALDAPVVEREDVVLARLVHEERLQLGELLGHLRRQVVRLAPVACSCRRAPRRRLRTGAARLDHPWSRVARHRRPALVVDAAVAEHLEVLRLAPLGGVGVVEGVAHAHALDRLLRDAVNRRRLGQAGRLEHRRRDVDHVVELAAHLALGRDALRPVHDRAVAGAAPVRGDLLRPLVRRVHRVRPADGVVVVGRRGAEHVDPGGHELGRLEADGTVQHDQLVERSRGASPSALAPLSPMM